MVQDTIFTKQRLINLSIIITAIWFTWFAQNFFDEYTVRIINNVAIFIILAVSYNLINGVTGQFSLEPNGFVAIGAYVTAILLVDAEGMTYQYYIEDPYPWVLALQTNFLWALILSGVISALLALEAIVFVSRFISWTIKSNLRPILPSISKLALNCCK